VKKKGVRPGQQNHRIFSGEKHCLVATKCPNILNIIVGLEEDKGNLDLASQVG
jgi:hypothetical protein